MERSAKDFLFDYIFSFSAYWICGGMIVAKLTEYFQFSLSVSNLLMQLPSALLILQPLGSMLYMRSDRKYAYLMRSNLLWRVCLCGLFFCVLLPARAGAAVTVAAFVLMNIAFQLCASPQSAWLISGFSRSRAGDRCYTTQETAVVAVYTVFLALCELFISFADRRAALRDGFVAVACVETLLLLLSCVYLLRLPKPESDHAAPASLRALLQPLREPNARSVLLMCGLTTFAGAATGFSGLYAVRVLGVDFTVILLCGLAGNAVRTLFGPVFSAIAAKRGWKRCLGIQLVYGMLVVPLWALTNAENALYTYPIMILLTSVTGSGVRIGQLRLQIAASTQDSRSHFLSLQSLLSGAATFLGGLLCSAIVHLVESGVLPHAEYRYIFLLVPVFSLLPLLSIHHVRLDVK